MSGFSKSLLFGLFFAVIVFFGGRYLIARQVFEPDVRKIEAEIALLETEKHRLEAMARGRECAAEAVREIDLPPQLEQMRIGRLQFMVRRSGDLYDIPRRASAVAEETRAEVSVVQAQLDEVIADKRRNQAALREKARLSSAGFGGLAAFLTLFLFALFGMIFGRRRSGDDFDDTPDGTWRPPTDPVAW